MKKYLLIIPIVLTVIIICLYLPKKKIYLTEKYYANNTFIETTDLSNLDNDTYILFTYNNYCTLPIPCEYIFEEFMKKYNISLVSIPFKDFKNTKYYKKVKYAPTIIIINNGKVISYLDANSDKDLDKYQDIEEFVSWISKYIYLEENK